MVRSLLCAAVLLVASWARAAGEPFEIAELPSEGRTIAAELADLDGDGRNDLLQITFESLPPDERRELAVFRQGPGGLPSVPSLRWSLPQGAAAYDLFDLDPTPGLELLLLRADGLLVVSLAGSEPLVRELPLQGRTTLAAAQDERGLDRARIAWSGIGEEPLLLLPVPGEFLGLSPAGEIRFRLATGTRANYLLPPPGGPIFFDSALQIFLDVPTLSVGDVDGDGRSDLVSASRYDLRVFRQRPDGSFSREPDQVIALLRVSEEDHIRGTGAVRAHMRDLDGDGRLDLLISQAAGAVTDARYRTTLHLNRGGSWDLARADQVFENRRAWAADKLLDLDADDRPELLRVKVPMSVFELIEVLITRALDAELTVHKSDGNGRFRDEPWIERKLDIGFNFETGRPRGFIPSVLADFNGDGQRDFLHSADGERIEVYLGGEPHLYRTRHGRQELPSQGRVRFGDVNGDGLDDFVLYAPRRPGAPLLVGINRGVLPGSPPRVSAVRE